MIRDSSSSYEIDYITATEDILNPEGCKIFIIGSEVTMILTKGLTLQIGGVALRKLCAQPVNQACFSLLNIYCFLFTANS